MMEVGYEEAMEWLDNLHKDANRRGRHKEQRMIEYIQEVLWRDNDMRNS